MKAPARILLLLFCVLLPGCIYPFDADLEGNDKAIVIEGNIQIGGTTAIRLSRLQTRISAYNPLSSSYQPSETVTEEQPIPFTAVVEGENGARVEASGEGSCELDTRALSKDQRYRLRIHDSQTGEDYSSAWLTVAEAPVVDSCGYHISDDKETAEFYATFRGTGETPYYSVAYDEEYEYRAMASSTLHWENGRVVEGEPYPNSICWMYKAKGVNRVVTTGTMIEDKMVDFPVRRFVKYDRELSILYHLRVYISMIPADAYRYWDNLDKISYQSGDLFAPIPSDVRGNLFNDRDPDALVLGYITASSVVVRDVSFMNSKESFYRTSPSDKLFIEANTRSDETAGPFSLANSGYVPYMIIPGVDRDYYLWIKSSCLDCRSLGGSIEKPEGWDAYWNFQIPGL